MADVNMERAMEILTDLASRGYNIHQIMDELDRQEIARKEKEQETKPKRRKMRKITVTILTESDKESAASEIEGLMDYSYDCFYSWDYKITETYVNTED